MIEVLDKQFVVDSLVATLQSIASTDGTGSPGVLDQG